MNCGNVLYVNIDVNKIFECLVSENMFDIIHLGFKNSLRILIRWNFTLNKNDV